MKGLPVGLGGWHAPEASSLHRPGAEGKDED